MSVENKVALVTGATRGIGAAILKQLAEQGCTVIGTATSESGAQLISDAIKGMRANGAGMVLNVCDQASIDQVEKQITEQFGRVEVLVNNAAVTRDNIMLRMKPEQWQEVIETNLTSVFNVSRKFMKGMVKARAGRIINITSVVGSMGNLGQANYCAAKAGVVGFAKSLSIELARYGITVNNVSPGFVDTDMTRALPEKQREELLKMIPLKRMAAPSDIADAVGFLVSDKASYITGETLHVNGGMHMA
ncbi:MAG: 3-oxoacyl-ACP reductase FabG [Coxiellaceae bacterium]|nr:3-oxoacyl-ACP reductase FabG [Coxiellaceae bacterium]